MNNTNTILPGAPSAVGNLPLSKEPQTEGKGFADALKHAENVTSSNPVIPSSVGLGQSDTAAAQNAETGRSGSASFSSTRTGEEEAPAATVGPNRSWLETLYRFAPTVLSVLSMTTAAACLYELYNQRNDQLNTGSSDQRYMIVNIGDLLEQIYQLTHRVEPENLSCIDTTVFHMPPRND